MLPPRNLSDTMDIINDKCGEFAIAPGLMMGTGNMTPDGISFGSVKELVEEAREQCGTVYL